MTRLAACSLPNAVPILLRRLFFCVFVVLLTHDSFERLAGGFALFHHDALLSFALREGLTLLTKCRALLTKLPAEFIQFSFLLDIAGSNSKARRAGNEAGWSSADSGYRINSIRNGAPDVLRNSRALGTLSTKHVDQSRVFDDRSTTNPKRRF